MRSKKSVLLEYGIYAFILVFVLFIAPNYLIEKVAVDGTSMENTLFDEERILIEKVSRYFDGPERFDIVVFTKVSGAVEKTYVKRIIGLPGETVRIVGNQIFINGAVLEESFGKDPIDYAGIASEDILLGEDEYFVLGDNRSVSIDSRSANVGAVKKGELNGVVIFRISPLSALGKVE